MQRFAMVVAVVLCLTLLTSAVWPPGAGQAQEGGGSAKSLQAQEENPLQAPLGGLRRMLKAMDALIAAFQQDSELFTKLVEVYQAGGPLWEELEACIERTHRQLQAGESI